LPVAGAAVQGRASAARRPDHAGARRCAYSRRDDARGRRYRVHAGSVRSKGGNGWFCRAAEAGRNVRPAGEDIQKVPCRAEAMGQRLRPSGVALGGRVRVDATRLSSRRIRVAVFSTGWRFARRKYGGGGKCSIATDSSLMAMLSGRPARSAIPDILRDEPLAASAIQKVAGFARSDP